MTGLAAKSGLMRGDVIIGVNQNSVADLKTFEKLLAASGPNLALLVRRLDNTLYIPLKLGNE